jgi:hypothetical protein
MRRGEDPAIRNERATAEGRAIYGKRNLPWELATGCSVAIRNAQTIIIDFPSKICTKINSFNIGTEIPKDLHSNTILLLRSRELLVVTDRTAGGSEAPIHQSALKFRPLDARSISLLVKCIFSKS